MNRIVIFITLIVLNLAKECKLNINIVCSYKILGNIQNN